MARRPVFRRYVLAEELLAVGLAEGGVAQATIDSGGQLVEWRTSGARRRRASSRNGDHQGRDRFPRPGPIALRRPGMAVPLCRLGFPQRFT